jgi:hypothetical protein
VDPVQPDGRRTRAKQPWPPSGRRETEHLRSTAATSASDSAITLYEVDWQEVIVGIRLAQASIDTELAARVEKVGERFRLHRIRALEACDRAVFDVVDDGVRRELEQALEELDSLSADVVSAVQGVYTYDLFDPLRVLVADVRHEHPSPIQRA